MILEVWVMTTAPGKEDEKADYNRRRAQASKRQPPSINCECQVDSTPNGKLPVLHS